MVLNNVVRGFTGRRIWLSKPSGAKERSLFAFDEKINRYYYNSREAMVIRIMESNEAVAAREFFGKETKQLMQLRANRSRLLTRLSKATTRQGRRIGDEGTKGHLSNARIRLEEVSKQIEELEKRDLSSSIGGMVHDLLMAGKIRVEDEYKMQRAMEAYFQPARASATMQFAKSLAYTTHIGNFLSAMVNLQDYSSVLYRSPRHALPATLRAVIPGLKNKYTQEELGLTSIDYDMDMYGAIQSMVFRGAGWKLLDEGMKNIYGDATLSGLQSQSRNPKNLKKGTDFMEKIEAVFGSNTEGIIKDLQSGKKTERTKKLVFNTMADRHPVVRSAMTEAYLRANWGRYFYTLRNFGLRDLQWHIDEAFRGFGEHPARSVRKLLWLAFTFTLARAGIEMLRDLLRGRKVKPTETVIDVWLNLLFLSRYNIDITRREGWWKGLVRTVTPPAPVDPSRGVRSVPLVGEPYYQWEGEGKRKREKQKGKPGAFE